MEPSFQTLTLLLLDRRCRCDADPPAPASLQRWPGCGGNHPRVSCHLRRRYPLTKELIFTALLPPLLLRLRFTSIGINCAGTSRSSSCWRLSAFCSLRRYRNRDAFSGGLAMDQRSGLRRSDRRNRPGFVIATFKEAKAHGRLLVLIEAESLLNDGTAAVAFGVVVAFSLGAATSHRSKSHAMLLKTIAGGVLCGAVVALGRLLLAGRTDDHLVEITFTTVAAYGSFLLADHFGLSGVLATITAGLVMGNFKSLNAYLRAGKGSRPGFLGIRCLYCELAGLSPDRNA